MASILKRIDNDRRVLIPQEIRDKLNLTKNQNIELEIKNNKVYISLPENDSEDGSEASDNA